MKNIKITIVLIALLLSACNEDKWLKEEAFDFYSADNSYTNAEQFNAAVARLYETVLPFYNFWPPYLGNAVFYTSDIAYDAIAITHQLNSYDDKLIPEAEMVSNFWQNLYRTIFDTNAIIGRIEGENVNFSSEDERALLKAEAHFFRAYAYRWLGILYGGVPIILEEIKEPKRDFVRATEDEVWNQCVSDLEYAVQNLPDVSQLKEDGRLTKAAANHLLTELYILQKDYDKAITAASNVIDDSNYALMTERFGTKVNEPGDVYSDLFRRGNQNRYGAGGNTESIWVKQYEYQVEGGGQDYRLPWVYVPGYASLTGDTDGEPLFIGSTNKYGRGAGWGVASDYLIHQVWEGDASDIRNSEYNIIRDIVADNPESAYYGQKIVESGAIDNYPMGLSRNWSAIFAKVTPINDFPDEVILDKETEELSSDAIYTFRDHYIFRLAETYLLRAEAYLGKGDLANAADDINVVRQRANATTVSPSDVTIDYILDERARELSFEEPRILTLMRTEKLVEYVKLRDPMHNGKYANHGISAHHRRWPIPQSEIERNTEAVLEQNPGYN